MYHPQPDESTQPGLQSLDKARLYPESPNSNLPNLRQNRTTTNRIVLYIYPTPEAHTGHTIPVALPLPLAFWHNQTLKSFHTLIDRFFWTLTDRFGIQTKLKELNLSGAYNRDYTTYLVTSCGGFGKESAKLSCDSDLMWALDWLDTYGYSAGDRLEVAVVFGR